MRAVITLGGGSVPESLLLRELADADILLSADGGAAQPAAAGRLPDVLVGDMDSIDGGLLRSLESSGAEIIRADPAKDETDGLLAVDLAIARGATHIVLLGALGGRPDHFLGNMALLLRAAKRGVRAVMRDAGCEISAATGEVKIAGRAGQTVSVLPVGDGVSVRYLDGLAYGTREPLPLPADAAVGVSNQMTADVANLFVYGWAFIVRIFQG
jgi:thiamine pyrophosphokinase